MDISEQQRFTDWLREHAAIGHHVNGFATGCHGDIWIFAYPTYTAYILTHDSDF